MTVVSIASAWPLYLGREFGLFTIALAVAGLPASALWTRIGLSRRLVNISVFCVAALAGAIAFAALAGGGAQGMATGIRAVVDSESLAMRVLVQVFAWIAAFRCWTLTTARDIPLSIVPAASILIVAAVIVTAGQLVVIAFAAVLVLSCLSATLYTQGARASLRIAAPSPPSDTRAAASAIALGAAAVGLAIPASLWLGSLQAPQQWRQTLRSIASVRLGSYLVYWTTSPAIVPSADVRLGGEPAVGERVLFRMKSRSFMLWRTGVFAKYDGASWKPGDTDSFLGKRLGEGWWVLPRQDAGLNAGVPARLVKQQFDLQALFQGYIPAAFELSKVRSFAVRARMNTASQASLSKVLPPGAVIAMASLRKLPPGVVKPVHGAVLGKERELYLACPRAVPARVRKLALDICRGLTEPLQKVKAIQGYLSTRCRYSLEANPPPTGREATDWFLFVTREGWCDHFASAAAVLCRCAGVPARLVTGYLSYEMDEYDWCVVREKHAHAWAEAFIEGYGWLEVNPSAKAQRDALMGRSEGPRAAWIARAVLPRVRAAWQRALEMRLWLWFAVVGAAALAGAATVRGVRSRPPVIPLGYDPLAAERFARDCYFWMKRWLAARGCAKAPGQTAFEYAEWLRGRLATEADPAGTIIAHYRKATYVGKAPSATEVDEIRQAMGALGRASWRIWWAARKRRSE
jgi:hypothetical protein